MKSNNGYDIEKQKKVFIQYKNLHKKRKIICYDDGDGVIKEENGHLYVRTKNILTGTPGKYPEPKWEYVGEVSHIDYYEVASIHIIYRSNGWAVKREGNSRADKIFENQADAIEYAKQNYPEETDIFVHCMDGSIQEWLHNV